MDSKVFNNLINKSDFSAETADELFKSGCSQLSAEQIDLIADKLLEVNSSQNKKTRSKNQDVPVNSLLLVLTKMFCNLNNTINAKLDKLIESNDNLTANNQILTARIEDQDRLINEMRVELKKNDKELRECNKKVWELETSINSNKFSFYYENLDTRVDNFENTVLCKIAETANIARSELSISDVRKIGKSSHQVVFSMSDKNLVSKIFKNFRNKKPENCFFNEFLTPHNAKIFANLRQLKKDGKIAATYTFRHKVYYKLNKESYGILVTDLSELGELCDRV
jgi:hypothetical protein